MYAVYNDAVSNAELPQEELGKDYMYALDATGKPYTPAWYTLNLKGQYSLNRYLTVNAGLENITDQRYRPYSSGISAAGRNLIISLRGRF